MSRVVPTSDRRSIVGKSVIWFSSFGSNNEHLLAFRSLGVLLYTLVYGAMPFDGSNFKRLVKQITTGDYYEPKNPACNDNSISKSKPTVETIYLS